MQIQGVVRGVRFEAHVDRQTRRDGSENATGKSYAENRIGVGLLDMQNVKHADSIGKPTNLDQIVF